MEHVGTLFITNIEAFSHSEIFSRYWSEAGMFHWVINSMCFLDKAQFQPSERMEIWLG